MSKTRTKKRGKATAKDRVGTTEMTTWVIGGLLILLAGVCGVSVASRLMCGPGPADTNWLGSAGVWVARKLCDDGFGLASFVIPAFALALALRVLAIVKMRVWKWFPNCVFLMLWLSVAAAYLQQYPPFVTYFRAGGMHGVVAMEWLVSRIGQLGTFVLLVITAVAYVLYLTGETVHTIRRTLAAARRRAERRVDEETSRRVDEPVDEPVAESVPEPVDTATTIEFDVNDDDVPPFVESESEGKDVELEIEVTPAAEEERDRLTVGETEPEAKVTDEGALEPYDPKLDLENYRYPTLDLLDRHEGGAAVVDKEEHRKNRDQIVNVLSTYGVEITSIKATVGPTVTLYEITPAPGVRINKIRSLNDDIALGLRALGIRIIAPIPGKGTIGIEVPNANPQMVSMESLINSRKFQESDYELPLALGKTITNEIYMVDLAKMPHLLVAGATGQGKSVGLNAIITSLLYRKHPAELKLVMVDPKKVEFSVYYPIVNHFLAQVEGTEDDEPIITDVSKVVQTLKSLCQEMDTRYDLLKRARVRNIKEYNKKFKDRLLNPQNGHKFMPYIVVIIDEFGDLIMTAGKEIEMPIARIAQLARAVGIHMIIATQRPSINIITGAIKANFPARMAFKVASMTDSKVVLDRPGANHLIGKGDMLMLCGTEPVRVQCAFVDTPEVERISQFIAQQQSYAGPMLLPPVESEDADGGPADVDLGKLDPLFDEVASLIVTSQLGSTSMIQRKFTIGYNRAGRLMDQLEKAGIVGPTKGSKPREVLVASDEALQSILNNLR